jgi:hypothetical protein
MYKAFFSFLNYRGEGEAKEQNNDYYKRRPKFLNK